MKRVKAACILQTLVFRQKEDCGLNRQQILQRNHAELNHYTQSMDRTRIRYQVISVKEEEDGSLLVHVRKQYNDSADVKEYFL